MDIRQIDRGLIVDAVRDLCIEACTRLPEDVYSALLEARSCEPGEMARDILEELAENVRIARDDSVPVCQDTGLALVFVEIGNRCLCDFDLCEAVNEGVRRGYGEGYLRKSCVRHPLDRVNTGDNTPAVIHLKLAQGDKIRITVAPKGGGSENMSRVKVFPPAAGREGVIGYILDSVREAGANPCPPIILGIGLGGTIEVAARLSKEALLRDIGSVNPVPADRDLEEELLRRVNELDIGPAGYGGRTTALAVFVKSHPCHIASLPVAITFQCHAARHKEAVI
ncbi:MAG: fumarate hydratase [Abditibacteriota bacterium]|nr:fumarate hydratase [Abditibacteriota bacterium]